MLKLTLQWFTVGGSINQHFQKYRNMENKQAVQSLAALAHETRLNIFRALVVAGPQGLNPGVLAEQAGIPAATLSFHLKELSHAGLIGARRESRNLFYSANFDHMNTLLGFLTENCCAGQPCETNTDAACGC